MARPKIVIDLEQVTALAKIGCTFEEMATVLKCSAKTLQRRYVQRINEGRLDAKASLRKWQWDAAKRGSPALLIWLGKQELGQTDKNSLTGKDGGPIITETHDVTDERLDERIRKLTEAVATITATPVGNEDRARAAARGEAETTE